MVPVVHPILVFSQVITIPFLSDSQTWRVETGLALQRSVEKVDHYISYIRILASILLSASQALASLNFVKRSLL